MNKKPNHKFAQEQAMLLLKRYKFDKPPIRPEVIAKDLGIRIFLADLEDKVGGYYDFKEKKIFINRNNTPQRQRFTIAHELGHYFLHSEFIRDEFMKTGKYHTLRREIADDPKELEANTFASHLLMPSHLFDKYKKVALKSEMVKIFGVSEEAYEKKLAYQAKFRGGV